MIRKIDDLSIRGKIYLLYALGVLIPMLIVGAIVTGNIADEVRRREEQNLRHSFDRVYANVSAQLESIVALGNAIAADTSLNDALARVYATPGDYYVTYCTTIRPSIAHYLNAYRQQVLGIELYTGNLSTLNGGVCLHVSPALREQPWHPGEIASSGVFVAYTQQPIGFADRSAICYLRPLARLGDPQRFLKINLYVEPIRRMFAQEEAYMTFRLLSPQIDGSPFEGQGAFTILKDFASTPALLGWRLAAVADQDAGSEAARRATLTSAGVFLCFTPITWLLCWLLTRSLVRRSGKLLWYMDHLSVGHFTAIPGPYANDEIGQMTQHFNDMSERMRHLIEDVETLHQREKALAVEQVRSELKYLQAQVDPHFLFNTLNGLLVVSVRNGYTELTEVIRAMSKVFRRMVTNQQPMVPIEEEMDFVAMVLTIERFRFGDKLRSFCEVAPSARGCPVPVMCVQGLVENACKHGIQAIDGQGEIRVTARREGSTLLVEVRDNGAGMEPEQLEQVRAAMVSADENSGGIGLRNIYRRLMLLCGEDCRMQLDAEPGHGTRVTLSIPVAARKEG